jgi:hypothetical protein
MVHFNSYIVVAFLFLNASALAQESFERSLPNEFETTGGHSLGLANAGMAATTGVSAVRLNPAMLSLEKTYSLAGGYNWPTEGRDFFQVGVVDSKSSSTAAGFIYNGFLDDYEKDPTSLVNDSPLQRRATLALSQTLQKLSVGISGQYVEAYRVKNEYFRYEEVKGFSLGFGVAGLLTSQLRFGLSVENLANKKIAEYSPRTYRAGIAYLVESSGDISIHLDFKQRDRIAEYEQTGATAEGYGMSQRKVEEELKVDGTYKQPERLVITSVSARVYDMLRILGGIGQSLGGPDRQMISGGLALVNNNMSLSYTAMRPYLQDEQSQQAANMAFAVDF